MTSFDKHSSMYFNYCGSAAFLWLLDCYIN